MTQKGKKIIKILAIVLGSIGAFVGIIALIVSLSGSKIQTITIGGVSKELVVGNIEYSTVDLTLSVYPNTAADEPLAIYSENEQVANVEYANGVLKVTALSEGVTNIYVVSRNNTSIYDKCEIVVKDYTVEEMSFYEIVEEELLETEFYTLKRDGSTYSIPFNVYPFASNLENIEAVFDKSVFYSVSINQKNMTVDIQAKENADVDSSLITFYFKQNTTEGLKNVSTTYLKIFIEPKKIELKAGLLGSDTAGYSYTTEHSNLIYLDKNDDDVNSVRVKLFLDYVLSDNRTTENFSTDKYNVLINGDIASNKVKIIPASTKEFFTIQASNELKYDTSVLVTFIHKETGTSVSLVVTGAESTLPSTVAESQNIALNSRVSAEINNATLSGGEYKILLRDVYEIVFDGKTYSLEEGLLELGIINIIKINNTIFIDGVSLGEIEIDFNIKTTYWDSRFTGEEGTVQKTVTFTVI